MSIRRARELPEGLPEGVHNLVSEATQRRYEETLHEACLRAESERQARTRRTISYRAAQEFTHSINPNSVMAYALPLPYFGGLARKTEYIH